jgi:hypothetical protein
VRGPGTKTPNALADPGWGGFDRERMFHTTLK